MLATILTLGMTSARVVDNPQEENMQDRQSLDKLLLQADPHENDIFYEARPAVSIPRRERPARPSPTLHLLENFSKQRYIDASEFRMPLPPAIDINRQLTLLSASKSFRPPTKAESDIEAPIDFVDYSFLPNPSPLFREDFPSDDVEYYQDTPKNSTIDVGSKFDSEQALAAVPQYSTSVSVSSSVSFSDNRSQREEKDTPKSEQSVTDTSSTDIVSTTSEPRTPIIDEKLAVSSSSESPKTAKLLRYDVEEDYPEYSVLSPLAHILSGFRGELGPFGGDHATDSFVRGFRPIGF